MDCAVRQKELFILIGSYFFLILSSLMYVWPLTDTVVCVCISVSIQNENNYFHISDTDLKMCTFSLLYFLL